MGPIGGSLDAIGFAEKITEVIKRMFNTGAIFGLVLVQPI